MKNNFMIISWYAFDMGNSAHALLISTVGFALYFKEYLYKGNPNGDTAWGLLTALILVFSAILSPFLTSKAFSAKNRPVWLTSTTVLCVLTTGVLGLSENILTAIFLYFLSALGYYLALPIYNSYLPNIASTPKYQKVSGAGWALGYLGGIIAVAICYILGYLDYSASDNPEIYRRIFLVAAGINFVFSAPLLLTSWKINKITYNSSSNDWKFQDVIEIFKLQEGKHILNILIVYWLIGEAAVVVTYYFAIFLKQYSKLSEGTILIYSIVGQFVAIISTYFLGVLSGKYKSFVILKWIIITWIFIPIILFLMSKGLSFWFPVFIVGLVIGPYHSIIRGKIAELSDSIHEDKDKGALFGFLEVSGRISQILGPLMIAFVTLFLPLNLGIVTISIFPLIALLLLFKIKWS